jgi:hypothetical protein
MRRRLLLVAGAGILAAIVPIVLQRFLLPSIVSLELEAGLAAYLYLSGALTVLLILLAIPRSQNSILGAIRTIVLVAALAVMARNVFAAGYLTWARIVGPRALVIVPDRFSGIFGIYIKHLQASGLATAGKMYTYRVPANGAVEADTGWIALQFAGRFDPYITHIQWASGTSMPLPDCQWVEDEWLDRGPNTVSSMSKTLGIACSVGSERLGRGDAQKFFRDHFKIEGVHSSELQRSIGQK